MSHRSDEFYTRNDNGERVKRWNTDLDNGLFRCTAEERFPYYDTLFQFRRSNDEHAGSNF